MDNLKLIDRFLESLDVGYGVDYCDSDNPYVFVFVDTSKRILKFIRLKVKEMNLKMRKRGNYYIITA